jgi:hypothetical protein
MFFKSSRYSHVKEHQMSDPQGRTIRYKGIRLISDIPAQVRHIVIDGERLDRIAFRYYQDSEQFWRICDTNRVMRPESLTAHPGRTIGIPAVEK